MRGVTLLMRRAPVSLKDGVDKGTKRPDCPSFTFGLLALRRLRIRQSLPHHPAVHPQLVRHPLNRPGPELVFPGYLL
jgi:hypothetical protein